MRWIVANDRQSVGRPMEGAGFADKQSENCRYASAWIQPLAKINLVPAARASLTAWDGDATTVQENRKAWTTYDRSNLLCEPKGRCW